MSVVQLPVGGEGSRALELLAGARQAVNAGAQVDLTSLSSHHLSELTAELADAQSSLAAWALAAAAEADRRQIAEETGDADTAAWLAHLIAEPREMAAGSLWLAKQLNETYAATREALRQGTLRLDQARVIVAAGRRAPAGVTPEQLAEAQRLLVAKATGGRWSASPTGPSSSPTSPCRIWATGCGKGGSSCPSCTLGCSSATWSG